MQIKIERNVPVPTGKYQYESYPFRDMKIGDSFALNEAQALKVRPAAAWFSRRNPDYRFKTRTENGKIRVWRVKPKTKQTIA